MEVGAQGGGDPHPLDVEEAVKRVASRLEQINATYERDVAAVRKAHQDWVSAQGNDAFQEYERDNYEREFNRLTGVQQANAQRHKLEVDELTAALSRAREDYRAYARTWATLDASRIRNYLSSADAELEKFQRTHQDVGFPQGVDHHGQPVDPDTVKPASDRRSEVRAPADWSVSSNLRTELICTIYYETGKIRPDSIGMRCLQDNLDRLQRSVVVLQSTADVQRCRFRSTHSRCQKELIKERNGVIENWFRENGVEVVLARHAPSDTEEGNRASRIWIYHFGGGGASAGDLQALRSKIAAVEAQADANGGRLATLEVGAGSGQPPSGDNSPSVGSGDWIQGRFGLGFALNGDLLMPHTSLGVSVAVESAKEWRLRVLGGFAATWLQRDDPVHQCDHSLLSTVQVGAEYWLGGKDSWLMLVGDVNLSWLSTQFGTADEAHVGLSVGAMALVRTNGGIRHGGSLMLGGVARTRDYQGAPHLKVDPLFIMNIHYVLSF